jgi:hypothetical protein
MEINNLELKNQITLFESIIDTIKPPKAKIINVIFRKVNDSTVLYDITYNNFNINSISEGLLFTFVCKINNRDILFLDTSTMVNSVWCFTPSKESSLELLKRNFNEEYEENKNIPQDDNYQLIDDTEHIHFHLTFINNTLVRKKTSFKDMVECWISRPQGYSKPD